MKVFYTFNYSFLKLSTGFAVAAFIDCQLIVKKEISITTKPELKNGTIVISVRYANPSSQLDIIINDIGIAIIIEIIKFLVKSFPVKTKILGMVAPITFLIPITFDLCLFTFFIHSSNYQQDLPLLLLGYELIL